MSDTPQIKAIQNALKFINSNEEMKKSNISCDVKDKDLKICLLKIKAPVNNNFLKKG
jgi:hypothetical protein